LGEETEYFVVFGVVVTEIRCDCRLCAGTALAAFTEVFMAMRSPEPMPSPAPRLSFLSCADGCAERHRDTVLLIARIALGVIFLRESIFKFMDLNGFIDSMAGRGMPMASLIAPIAAVAEFCGGVAVILGFATRYAALLMVAFTIAASLTSHRYWEQTGNAARNNDLHFYKNLSVIGGFLALFVAGAGRYSIDALIRRH
jgi:putative oxidoreductase